MRVPLALRLSRSLTLRILAVVWASFAVTFVLLIALNARELRQALIERGRLRASSIADLLEYAYEPLLERGDLLSIQRCAENAATIEGVERVWVVGREGRILAAGDAADVGRQVTAEAAPLAALLEGKEPERVWQEGHGRAATLNLVKPLRGGGFDPRDRSDLIAAIWLKLSLRPLYQHITASILSLSAVSLLCAGILSLGIGWVLSRTVARPLVELSRVTTEVAHGNLDAVVPVRGRDEIGQLARNFRTMTHALAEARREVDGFLYLVSHDLRGPLINIEGFTQRLRSTLEEAKRGLEAALPRREPEGRVPGPAARASTSLHDLCEREAPQSLDFIEKSVDRIRRLVEGLMKLSRLPMRDPEIRSLHTQELVDRIVASLRYQISARSAEIEVRSLPVVFADELLLSEVFTNLIQNALQYMGSQPRPHVAIDCERQGEEWRFSVRDNGAGISPKNLPRLFMPFQRFSPEGGEGEGIGLCLVRRFLQRMGGSIWAESKPGAGTTFYFTLPLEPSPQRASLQGRRPERGTAPAGAAAGGTFMPERPALAGPDSPGEPAGAGTTAGAGARGPGAGAGEDFP